MPEAQMSVEVASQALGLSPARVAQLFHSGTITGSQSVAKGPIWLDAESVLAYKPRPTQKRRDASGAEPTEPAQAQPPRSSPELKELRDMLAAVLKDIEMISDRQLRQESRLDRVATITVAFEAINSELRSAAEADDEVIRLMSQAVERSRDSAAAWRRAEALRAQLAMDLSMPEFPPEN